MPVAEKLGFNPKTFPTFKTADRRPAGLTPSPLGSRTMDNLFAELRNDRREEWKKILEDFEEDPVFFNSHQYLNHHPIFYRFAFSPTIQKSLHERYLESDCGLDGRNFSLMVRKVDRKSTRLNSSHWE